MCKYVECSKVHDCIFYPLCAGCPLVLAYGDCFVCMHKRVCNRDENKKGSIQNVKYC